MKRIDLSKFLFPKPWRLPGWSASFPSFSVSGSSRRRHSPSVRPEELVGGVGWLVWDMRVDFRFVCLFVVVWGDWSGNRLKQIQNKLAKEFCCHIPSPPTNCGSDQGPAARTTFGSRCCMPASFRPKFESGETQRDRLEDSASPHGHPQRRRKEARMGMAAPVSRTFVPSLHASLGPL